MKRNALTLGGLLAAVAALAISVVPAVLAQMAPPTESKGVSGKVIGTLPLAPEFDRTEGRQLRMRVVTLARGGAFAIHDHKDRPSAEYVLKGSAKEFKVEVSKT